MITIERIKNIADDIIADDEWINDSHTQSEHNGIKAGILDFQARNLAGFEINI